MKKATQSQGFTLYELMMTLAVVGVVAALSVPMFGDIVKNNRLATQVNNMLASLNYARNESVTRGVSVRLEPIVSGTDWTAGWRVRVDGNDDGDFSDSEDVVTRNFEQMEATTLTLDNAANNVITYLPNGQINRSDIDDLSEDLKLKLVANECTDEDKRVIDVRLSGQARMDPSDQACP